MVVVVQESKETQKVLMHGIVVVVYSTWVYRVHTTLGEIDLFIEYLYGCAKYGKKPNQGSKATIVHFKRGHSTRGSEIIYTFAFVTFS